MASADPPRGHDELQRAHAALAEQQRAHAALMARNAELEARVEALGRANSDLHNLMSATRIATVFLDLELRVTRHTPAAAVLFGLGAEHLGRPLAELGAPFCDIELEVEARQALRSQQPLEREMRCSGRWLMARVLPYRTAADDVAGVVLTFIDITDRKSFEGALRASEQRLQTLADAVPQIIWTNDGEGHAVYFNRRWYEYSGLTLEASVGPGWQAIVHPDDMQRAVARWQRAQVDGRTFDCEFRLRGADGSYRWFIARNVPTREAEGRVDGWFGTATDIHDLKLAEASLRASEEQFRRAIEEAPIPVIMQAEDGQVLQISKAWSELTGFLPEEVTTLDAWLKRAEGHGAQQVRERVHDLFSGNASVLNAELDIATRDGGARHWVFWASAPRTLRDGRRFIVGMANDVTEGRGAEQQLRQSQERLRLIVENARDYAIISLDLERRITSWNSGAQAILGYTHEEALGLSGDVIFTAEDRAAGAPQHEADTALAVGRAADERWHVRKDGARFWGSGVLMAMRDTAGQALGLVKIFRDQTAELHAKQAMEQARAELRAALQETEIARDQAEAAGRAKDRFLAVLSHELRAPLTPVLLATQLLAIDPQLSAAARDAIEVIERNVRLQVHLIDDLLDVSRIVHGKMEQRLAPMDLHVALQRAVELAHADLQAARQQLVVALEASEHRIEGDAQRLQQMFWNLLRNASKFTPEGGHISLCSRSGGGTVRVEVADTGAGFHPEDAERIFGAFEQGSRTVTARYGGLGLGLAIARATALAHGGRISASSEGPGRGAVFTVELPLSSAAQTGGATL